MLHVTYKGGESELIVGPECPVLGNADGDTSLLKPGAAVFVIALKNPDGTVTSARLYAEKDAFAGYGANRKAFFWIGHRAGAQTSTHVAFTAQDRETVEQFHRTALAAGGQDNGPPGLRPHYDKDYYGAFVLDPDGHNIEAVCRKPA